MLISIYYEFKLYSQSMVTGRKYVVSSCYFHPVVVAKSGQRPRAPKFQANFMLTHLGSDLWNLLYK